MRYSEPKETIFVRKNLSLWARRKCIYLEIMQVDSKRRIDDITNVPPRLSPRSYRSSFFVLRSSKDAVTDDTERFLTKLRSINEAIRIAIRTTKVGSPLRARARLCSQLRKFNLRLSARARESQKGSMCACKR